MNQTTPSVIVCLFLFAGIMLNACVLLGFVQHHYSVLSAMTHVFCASLLLYMLCSIPLSVHAKKQGGSQLCRNYALGFASLIAAVASSISAGILAGEFCKEFPNAVFSYIALILFMSSYFSGYAVLPFLRHKRTFLLYLAAQTLSLCSLFGSAGIIITIAEAC